jgi:hypothetical protein
MFTAARLDSELKEKIGATLEMNSMAAETILPAPEEKQAEYKPEYRIIEDEPPQGEPLEGELHTGDEEDDDEPPPPSAEKKAWYEKLGEKLKSLTYPIAAALEVAKHLPIPQIPPFLRTLNFPHLASKVRNVIDNVVTTIKTVTGALSIEQAAEERKNNETALAGHIITKNVPNNPIAERLKQTFGKVGAMIKHVAQQTILKNVPEPVRNVIIAGAQKIGSKIASGIKSFVQQKAPVVAGFFGKLKEKIFGK